MHDEDMLISVIYVYITLNHLSIIIATDVPAQQRTYSICGTVMPFEYYTGVEVGQNT